MVGGLHIRGDAGTKAAVPGHRQYLRHSTSLDKSQLGLVLDVLGSPSPDEINSFPNAQTRDFLKSQEKRSPRPMSTMFKDASPLAIDLLEKLLKFDATKRITIEEALVHPYLKDLHCPSDEVHARSYEIW